MKARVFELSREWLDGWSGAPCAQIGEVEADDMTQAVLKARQQFPGKSLRIDNGECAVEVPGNGIDPDVEKLSVAVELAAALGGEAYVGTPAPALHIYHVDDGEESWYCAESREEALEMYLEPLRNPQTGKVDEGQLGCEVEEIDVDQLPDDSMLGVYDEDRTCKTLKTAAEWAKDGKGFVATTAW